jgi:hypothetical protein
MTCTVLDKNKVTTEELIKHCSDLRLASTLGSDAGTKVACLCDELFSIQNFVKKLKNPTPFKVLIQHGRPVP